MQVTVAECTLSAAILKPEYINCKNFSFSFENEFILTNVSRYSWDFGVAAINSDTSNAIVGNYTYPDTGKYTLKLRVTSAAGCEDSTTADVLVYPVFKAGFKVAGSCLQFPFQFTDISTAQYGTVSKWLWDFGDAYSSSNTSTLANPSHLFSVNGSYTSTLVATGSKGCMDTASAIAMASDKPILMLPFRDTLICSIDTLTLHVNSPSLVAWTPAPTLLNPGSSSPIVFPKVTTKYYVTVDEQGCVAKDSVLVNVLDFITVTLPADTTICTTDTIQLQPVSAGLQYQWSPNNGLSNSSIKNPKAAPLANTTYQLMVNLGKCKANADININVVPYPLARVSADTTICFGSIAQLRGSITGSSFNWSPVSSLRNASSLSPVASPQQTTAYQLTVRDTKGCPKPSVATVTVTVTPQIHAFAGNDTSIVAGQPLQLNANGGTAYLWSPANGLSNVAVPNPIAVLNASVKAITYVVTATNGTCSANDSINVKIFANGPEIYVPSAFTPNGDGKNDVLRPILVGIKSLETFRVFSRWGQMVYSSNQPQKGWDGEINGTAQQMGTYVYIAIGTTYLDQKITKKGTVILIR